MGAACCEDGDLLEAKDGFLGRWKTFASIAAAMAWLVGIVGGLGNLSIVADVALVVAVVVGGATFVPGATKQIVRGRLSVSVLMTVAGVGALALGQIGEAASLAFLFSISEALEEWAITKSRRGLRSLLQLVPERTIIRRNQEQIEVATDTLVSGDVLVVRAGGRVATDGIVRAGRSTVDVSAITGESIPVECDVDDIVLAGSINGGGLLDIEATAPAGDSTLAQIVLAVEEAQDRKGRSQRLADRIARPLVPGILLVAILVAVVGAVLGDPELWFQRSLVVLVAASPCAFAIAVPVTVSSAIGAATSIGLVIKGGAALEVLATVETVVFDKTGTLTRNQPTVIDTVSAAGYTTSEVLEFAAALEAQSDHPLAAAILAASDAPALELSDVQTFAGLGISGYLDGRKLRVGKPGFIDSGVISADVERLQNAGATVVVVEHQGITVGAIAIRDELRPEVPAIVAALQDDHRTRVVMLSGDNAATVRAIGLSAGIDEVHAGLLPNEKTVAIEQLRADGPVAMVGDGINDAPALATADVGIAMGASGTDVAVEAADIVIVGDHLTHLPGLIEHARRARNIMIQSLVLSGLIITVLVPIAATGLLGLGAIVAAHELAEIFVIGNGMRARRLATVGGTRHWL